MTTDEATPIVELIEARYIHNKTFYRQSALSVFYDVLEPYDYRLGHKVVREWLDARREPPTDSELAAALRQQQRRQNGRPHSDADKYKPQPGVDCSNEKQAFRALYEGWELGAAPPPVSRERAAEIEAKLREDQAPKNWLFAVIVPALGPKSMDEAIAQKGGKG